MLGMRAGIKESRGENRVRTVYTDANETITVHGRGPGPTVGGKVWTSKRDIPEGRDISTITKVV